MTVLVLGDGNWLLHRAVSVISRNSQVQSERKVASLILNWFSSYCLQFRAQHGALCFDGANNFRYEVYSDYKSNRGRGKGNSGAVMDMDNDQIYQNLPFVIALFNTLGVPCYQNDKFEADDLMAAGAFHWKSLSESNSSVIVCRDKDLLQAVSSRIAVYFPAVGTQPECFYDSANVKVQRGFTPGQFADYQILIGDDVDTIPSILTPKKAEAILLEHFSLKNFFKTKDGEAFFRKHSTALIRNQSLIRMNRECWKPSLADLKLPYSSDFDSEATSKFGSLPKSFISLRSSCRPKASLF